MNKFGCFILITLLNSASLATTIEPMPINELASKSDHILIGTVYDIKILNKKGKEIKALNSPAGPDSENAIHYYIKIDKSRTLKSTSNSIPSTYSAKAWEMWHKELKIERDIALGKTVVLFLTGNDFRPTSPSEYIQIVFNSEVLAEIKSSIKTSQ